MLGTHKAVGVKGNRESARWFWNHHFAAVAGDAIAFEVLPPTIEDEGNRDGTTGELGMYHISTCPSILGIRFLSGYGAELLLT